LASHSLKENQRHIGDRCVFLLSALVQTALETAIKEACGFIPDIQKTAQKNYLDTTRLIQELGFQCSLPHQIATKKDITQFLKVPEGTLNSFLHKHSQEIEAIPLDSSARKSIGCKATRMNGYKLDDVVKIAVGMDTETGIELKKKMFGQVGLFASPKVKDEIQWRQTLSKVFAGFGLHYNYPVGKYRVDFFVEQFMMVLECNGYEHRYYDPREEMEREKVILEKYSLIRFHHKISLETLVNGILQAKSGHVVRLDSERIGQNCFRSL
jgi:very-short-patch-repair endonuclease